jgi:hypothetical protein
MRDASFHLDPAAAAAGPPYRYGFIDRPWPAPAWSVRDGANRQAGLARTRAGARAAVRALYGAVETAAL